MTPESYRRRRPDPFEFDHDAVDMRLQSGAEQIPRSRMTASAEKRYQIELKAQAALIASLAAPSLSEEDLPPGMSSKKRDKMLGDMDRLDGQAVSQRAVELELLPQFRYLDRYEHLMASMVVPAAREVIKGTRSYRSETVDAAVDILCVSDLSRDQVPPFGDGATVQNLMHLALDPNTPLKSADRKEMAAHFVAQSREMGRLDRRLEEQAKESPEVKARAIEDVRQSGKQASYFSKLESFSSLSQPAFDRQLRFSMETTYENVSWDMSDFPASQGAALDAAKIADDMTAIKEGLQDVWSDNETLHGLAGRLIALGPLCGTQQEELLAVYSSNEMRHEQQKSIQGVLGSNADGHYIDDLSALETDPYYDDDILDDDDLLDDDLDDIGITRRPSEENAVKPAPGVGIESYIATPYGYLMAPLREVIESHNPEGIRHLAQRGHQLDPTDDPVLLVAQGEDPQERRPTRHQSVKSVRNTLSALKDVGIDIDEPRNGVPAAHRVTAYYGQQMIQNFYDKSPLAEDGKTDTGQGQRLAEFAKGGVDFSATDDQGRRPLQMLQSMASKEAGRRNEDVRPLYKYLSEQFRDTKSAARDYRVNIKAGAEKDAQDFLKSIQGRPRGHSQGE
jgi:hypothetical protein